MRNINLDSGGDFDALARFNNPLRPKCRETAALFLKTCFDYLESGNCTQTEAWGVGGISDLFAEVNWLYIVHDIDLDDDDVVYLRQPEDSNGELHNGNYWQWLIDTDVVPDIDYS